MPELPQPECSLGYTEAQVTAIMGSRLPAFDRWMNGQTQALCDGRKYDPGIREYLPTGHAHGIVTYPVDVERFLEGLPVND